MRIVYAVIVLIFVSASLQGCGLKGPLKKPQRTEQRTTLTQPADIKK